LILIYIIFKRYNKKFIVFKIKIKIKIKIEIYLIYSYFITIDKAKIYFEYGLCSSIYQASIRNNIIKIYTVESDKNWLDI
jgi:hypothetical protein